MSNEFSRSSVISLKYEWYPASISSAPCPSSSTVTLFCFARRITLHCAYTLAEVKGSSWCQKRSLSSSKNRSAVGHTSWRSTRLLLVTRSIHLPSSRDGSSNRAESVFCTALSGNSRLMTLTTVLESSPPDRLEPTGTSARNRRLTEFVKCSRKPSVYCASDQPSIRSRGSMSQ